VNAKKYGGGLDKAVFKNPVNLTQTITNKAKGK